MNTRIFWLVLFFAPSLWADCSKCLRIKDKIEDKKEFVANMQSKVDQNRSYIEKLGGADGASKSIKSRDNYLKAQSNVMLAVVYIEKGRTDLEALNKDLKACMPSCKK